MRWVGLGVLVCVLLTGGCGGSTTKDSSAPNVIQAGQVDLGSGQNDVQLPPGWKATKNGYERTKPGDQTAGKSGSGGSADDTVPLAKEDPQTAFFKAIGTFQSCLKQTGTKFIGAPDPKNPSSPTNDPNYLKNLSTCVAKSNIVQALKNNQTAEDNLTPDQVKTQNEGYLHWRDCMIGRGRGIPEPKPDAKGRLFSFGASNSAPQFQAPPGKDILTSSDVRDCATQSQAKANSGG